MTALLEHSRPLLTSGIDDIADKVFRGERLTFDDGVRLFAHPNLAELGALADFARQRAVPGRTVTYIRGRNVNYSNVCWVQCKFCAFYDLPSSGAGYTHGQDVLFQKIQEMVDLGGIEILLQGGLNPKLKIDYYENLFRAIGEAFPTVWIHGLSVAEILYIAKISRLSTKETLDSTARRGPQNHSRRGRGNARRPRAQNHRALQRHHR
jgi:cyclic dehypoxanthinyl futalosine synthase